MRPHELWFSKPKPPLLWGWLALIVGCYVTVGSLFLLMALGADPLAGVLGMIWTYLWIGWGILKYLVPRTVEWAELPTPLLVRARLGVVCAWPTRWGSILIAASWARLIQRLLD